MIGVMLALAASLSWGIADFGGGIGARRAPVVWVLLVSQAAGLVLVGTMWLATQPATPTGRELAWGVFGGVMGVVGLGAFYRALAIGTMGIVGPISATGAIVPIVYGLGRDERPSSLQAVGIAVAVIGVVGASLEPLRDGAGRKFTAGAGLALLAALGFGSALLGLNRVSQAGVVWGTLSLRLTVVPILLLAALLIRPPADRLRSRTILPLLLATGVFDSGANLLYGASARHGLISVVSVLGSLYPLVLVALAYFVLHERLARPQLAGVGLALAGVALISAG
ncbi:MAG TPA: DMT family transporter [Gaiellaceae bacterium]|nr:DMT family transporter [Gaiellaceae bacterium]